MALLTLEEILSESIEKKYAVGAFDTMNHSLTEAILCAAEDKDRPVILMVVEPLFDMPRGEELFNYIIQRCRNSKVPICLHLDHGKSFEVVMKAIHYGCTSVMFDGSMLPIEENIAITQKVVEVAHACGVSVEAEIGHVGGHEGNMLEGNVADESAYTEVKDAVRFTEETNVDALAVAIGTVHGLYKGEPKLDYKRLSELREAISIPLVMHGGSGLSPDHYTQAIRHGINKINYFTAMSLGGGNAVKELVKERSTSIHFFEILNVGMERMKNIVADQIDIFETQKLAR